MIEGPTMIEHGLSEAGLALLKQFEGCRLTAYKDSGGVLTVGVGHTGQEVTEGLRITQAQADAWLREDIAWANRAVNRNVIVPLTQNQHDALVSLTFNLGVNGYKGLLATLNTGRYEQAARELLNYCHAGGKFVQGLLNRRKAEKALFETPDGSQ